MEITKYSDFKTDDPKFIYEFKATVIELMNEGNANEKRPLRFKVLFEESGDVAEVVSWDFQYLAIVKQAVSETNVYELEVNTKVFKDIMNLKLINLRKTETISNRKVENKPMDTTDVAQELKNIVNKYVSNKTCLGILNKVLAMPEFYTRPAGMRIHHAYQGGLAEHTLGVTQIAINLYRSYRNVCSLDLLVTGAIIHDIGKIIEYTNDGKISFEGGFNSHIGYGISMVTTYANEMGLSIGDSVIMQLIGIISSHHNLLEYGSPSRPATPEAMLISFADHIDAGMKGALEAMSNLPFGSRTEPIKSLDGAKFTVMDNKDIFKNN